MQVARSAKNLKMGHFLRFCSSRQRAALSARNQLLKLRNRAIDGLGGVDMGTALRSKVESRVAVHENKPGGGSGGVKSQSEGQLMRGRHQLYWEMLKVRTQKG